MVKSVIEQRKLMQGANEENDDGEDFTVGTIKGLEPLDKKDSKPVHNVRHVGREQKNDNKGVDNNVSKATIEKQIENAITESKVTSEQLEGTVELKLRKTYAPLVQTIVNVNGDVIVQDKEAYFQLNAKQIKVTRTDGERALGKMNDGQWRMLFMNKVGEVASFTDSEFILGVVETEEETVKELAQLNTRIDSRVKLDMDEVRDLLGMTQAKFLEVAISEYVQRVRAEML